MFYIQAIKIHEFFRFNTQIEHYFGYFCYKLGTSTIDSFFEKPILNYFIFFNTLYIREAIVWCLLGLDSWMWIFLTHIYTASDVTLNCVCQRNSSCGVVNQNCRIAILLANLPNSLEEMFGQKSDNSLHLNVYTVMRILKSDKSMDYRKSMFHKQIRYFILFATLSKTPQLLFCVA